MTETQQWKQDGADKTFSFLKPTNTIEEICKECDKRGLNVFDIECDVYCCGYGLLECKYQWCECGNPYHEQVDFIDRETGKVYTIKEGTIKDERLDPNQK